MTEPPDSSANSEPPRGWRSTLRAFHYRNYRLFFFGQGTSLVGTWMQRIAVSWLVYSLTNSSLWLGIAGFVGQVPTFLMAPFAGVIVDRSNLRRLVVITQVLSMLQALALSALVLTGKVQVWHVLVLGAFLGVINSFDMPARQSLVVHMVEGKDNLPNAIALNSAMFNSARLVGPSVGGVLLAWVGMGYCFLLNGVSYIAVIWALLAMRLRDIPARAGDKRVWQEFKEGFSYAFGFPPIRSLLLLLSLVSLVGMPYQVLMPVLAKDILHGGPQTLGFLMAGAGAGALTGALALASRKSAVGLWKFIALAPAVFGLGLIGISLSRSVWITLPLMLVTGCAMMTQTASCNTMLQTIADDDKRGRVMSFYMMAFSGMSPFGSLIAGSLAHRLGTPETLALSGAACIVGAVLFILHYPSLRKHLRPVYERLGLTPGAD
jgi:MFS family permease